MALSRLKVETLLINGKDLTNNVETTLVTHLREMTLKELKLLAKNLNIKLTGSLMIIQCTIIISLHELVDIKLTGSCMTFVMGMIQRLNHSRS